MVRMIGPCNRQWHRLKMSVDVEYIPSCCIEKMHLHAAIFDLPVETEVVNECVRYLGVSEAWSTAVAIAAP